MMKMTTPDGSFAVKLNMIGFVDDSTTITSGERKELEVLENSS